MKMEQMIKLKSGKLKNRVYPRFTTRLYMKKVKIKLFFQIILRNVNDIIDFNFMLCYNDLTKQEQRSGRA